ncbi:hypothetical protein LCGC14_1324130 [marine sediment metagenome]|uniref:Uncharacterized protein n=1 Tax=marine sediment metagenome TaxID=412755 RepID=A0A0F9MZG2_9ZZZZ
MSFVPLEIANGPECPACGCRDAEILQPPVPVDDESKGWFERMDGGGRARCGHCGNVFAFAVLPAPIAAPAVVDEALGQMEFEPADVQPVDPPPKPRDTAYPVRECPQCGSPKTRTYRTMKEVPGIPRIRYHRCPECRATFKSSDSRHCSP